LLLWGASVFIATLVPRSLRFNLWSRLQRARHVLVFCLGVAVLATLPLQAGIIGDGWADALRLDVLASVANQTTIGAAWWCQLAGGIVLLFLSRARAPMAMRATAAVAGGLLASLAITGHAAMDDGVRGILHRVNDVMHVWAAGAWMGALPVVLLLLPGLKAPATAAAATQALSRFSTAGHAVVAIVMLSGVASMFLILGGLPADWSYSYQKLLALKILTVAGMAVLAIVNRYVLVPAMRRGPAAAMYFQRLTVMEIAMSAMAVFLVAWFGMLEPN
jgi:putative copper resistance protein D